MNNLKKIFLALFFASASFSTAASAALLDTADLTLVSSFQVDGHYNLAGVEFWNGLPLAPDNMPSSLITPMHADVNFYVRTAQTNQFYIEVLNVVTTQGASWYGNAFVNVTQTGVQFSLPLLAGGALSGVPGLSGAFAIAGETLLTPPNVITPLDTTPGYQFQNVADEFLVRTIDDDSDYGFVGNNFAFIDSAIRIRSGGVFELTFDPTVDLLEILDYGAMTMQTRYGNGTQYIDGVQTYAYIQPGSQQPGTGGNGPAVPEPSTLVLLVFGLAGLGAVRKFRF